MPILTSQFIDSLQQRILTDLFVSVFIIFALSFIPASFLVFIIEERETNTKQLQFVSGVKPYIYWISNFVWDLVNYAVPIFLCVGIFLAFDVKTYTSKENLPCLISLMLLYGWSVIPLMYLINYLFQVPSTAFVVASSMNVFIGVVTTMTITVLDSLADGEPDLKLISSILKPMFVVLFPHYGLGQGFIEMALLYNTAEINALSGREAAYNPFFFNNVGRNLLAMFCQGVVYFVLNILIQYKFFITFRPVENVKKLNIPLKRDQDDDVVEEQTRLDSEIKIKKTNKKEASLERDPLENELFIKHENEDKDYIKLINLTKVFEKFENFHFKKHTAVNNLSLGINKGECFGLIGVNGAGKIFNFNFKNFLMIPLISAFFGMLR